MIREKHNRERREANAAARADNPDHWRTVVGNRQVKWEGICRHTLTKARHTEVCWMALIGEKERLDTLIADEQQNPANYCTRVADVPETNVCSRCHGAGGLQYHKDFWGAYYNCHLCGADYFPDAEPVPILIQGRAAGAYIIGRHDDGMQVGERYIEYDRKYKAEKRRKNAKA
jgi:hypothetical protein